MASGHNNNNNNNWAPPQHPRLSPQPGNMAMLLDDDTQCSAPSSFMTSNSSNNLYLNHWDASFGTAAMQDNNTSYNPNTYAREAATFNSFSAASHPLTIDPALLNLDERSTPRGHGVNTSDNRFNSNDSTAGWDMTGMPVHPHDYNQGNAQVFVAAPPTHQDEVLHPMSMPFQAPPPHADAPHSHSSLPEGDSGSYGHLPHYNAHYQPHGRPAQTRPTSAQSTQRFGQNGNQMVQANFEQQLANMQTERGRATAKAKEAEDVLNSRNVSSQMVPEAGVAATAQAKSMQNTGVFASTMGPTNEEGSGSSATTSSRASSAQTETQDSVEISEDATSRAATSTSSATTSCAAGVESSARDYSTYPTIAAVFSAKRFQMHFSSTDTARKYAFRRIKLTKVGRDDVDAVKANVEHYVFRVMNAIASSSYLATTKKNGKDLNEEDQRAWTRWQEASGIVLDSVMSEGDKEILVPQIEAKARLIVEEIIKVHEEGYRPYKNVDLTSKCSERMEKGIECIENFTKVREDIIKSFDLQQFGAHPEWYGNNKANNVFNNKRKKDQAAAAGRETKEKKRATTLNSSMYANLYSRDEIAEKLKNMRAGNAASSNVNVGEVEGVEDVQEQDEDGEGDWDGDGYANDAQLDSEEDADGAEVDSAPLALPDSDSDDNVYEKLPRLPTKKRSVKRSMNDSTSIEGPAGKRARKTKAPAQAATAPARRSTRQKKSVKASQVNAGDMYGGESDDESELDDADLGDQNITMAAATQSGAAVAATSPAGIAPPAQNPSGTYGNITLASTSATDMPTRRSLRSKQTAAKGKRKQD